MQEAVIKALASTGPCLGSVNAMGYGLVCSNPYMNEAVTTMKENRGSQFIMLLPPV